jgi:hypothetical protein
MPAQSGFAMWRKELPGLLCRNERHRDRTQVTARRGLA